jgi:hypothetical protein
MLSHKHLCLLDGQAELGNQAFAPIGKSMRLYKGGGGGGGSVRYDNLDKLYAAQTEQAKLLGDVARDTVVPQYQALMADAQGMGGVQAQEKAADTVGRDYQVSAANNRKMTDRNMAGMGINVNDERYMRSMNGQASQDALAEVGLKNQERNRTRDLGFARRQDLVGMGLGLPSQAAQAYSTAANGMATQQNQQQQFAMQQQQANNSAISGAVSGGLAGYGLYKSFADGGVVRRDGSRAFAGGGFTGGGAGGAAGGGFTKPINAPMAPPPSGIPKFEPTTGQRALMGAGGAAQGAAFGKLAGNAVGDSVRGIGNLTGNAGMQQFGADIASGANNAGSIANTMVNKAFGSATPYAGLDGAAAAATTGAEVAAGTAAGTTAAAGATAGATAGTAAGTTAATGAAAGGAGLTIGAAMPYVGAAMLADQALGLGITEEIGGWLGFADGGEVDMERVDGLRGGEVDGEGGPTDDLIPAWLSDGEFVMTAEAVQHFGLDKLNKMNQVGLAIRNGSFGKDKASKEKAA